MQAQARTDLEIWLKPYLDERFYYTRKAHELLYARTASDVSHPNGDSPKTDETFAMLSILMSPEAMNEMFRDLESRDPVPGVFIAKLHNLAADMKSIFAEHRVGKNITDKDFGKYAGVDGIGLRIQQVVRHWLVPASSLSFVDKHFTLVRKEL